MVFEGTKIGVISSSENGKGNKIRRGSLGYLSEVGTQIYAGKNSITTVIAPAKIIFTRFGFQKRERSESKLVHLVFPLEWDKNTKNPLNHLDKITKRAKDINPDVRRNLNALSSHTNITGSLGHNTNSTKLPSIVIKELCSDITSSEYEFKSWLKSILSGQIIVNLIRTRKKSKINKTYDVLKEFHPDFRLIMNSDKLNNIIDDICCLDKERQKVLINSLKSILNLYKSSIINPLANTTSCFVSVTKIINQSYPLYWQISQSNEHMKSAPFRYGSININHRRNIDMWLKFIEKISI